MKKRVAIVLSVIMLAMSLAACGGGGSSASVAGSYKATQMEADGEMINIAEYEAMLGMKLDFSLELKEDGKASMSMMGESRGDGEWKQDGSTVTLTFEGESAQAEYKNGKITLEMDGDKVIFEKK